MLDMAKLYKEVAEKNDLHFTKEELANINFNVSFHIRKLVADYMKNAYELKLFNNGSLRDENNHYLLRRGEMTFKF